MISRRRGAEAEAEARESEWRTLRTYLRAYFVLVVVAVFICWMMKQASAMSAQQMSVVGV